MPWALGALLLAVAAALAWRLARRWADRAAARSVLKFRARVDRYKFTRKAYVRAELLTDEEVADAVAVHAAEQALPEPTVWRRVEAYVDEIVPFFNLLAYYRVGY